WCWYPVQRITASTSLVEPSRKCAVRFSTPVRMVRFDDETKKFTVTAHNSIEDRMYDEEFDYVVVASGHFSKPNVPYFEGVKTF
ncbi:hypothetical protein AB9F39_37335, partial [Rhizobium leguminosarum]